MLSGPRYMMSSFKDENAIGKVILVGKLPTKVIGVLEEKGGGPGGPNIDDRVIMPFTTVTSRIANDKRYLSMVRLKTDRDLDKTIEDVRTVLRSNHGLQGSADDDFTIRSSKDILKFVTVISGSALSLPWDCLNRGSCGEWFRSCQSFLPHHTGDGGRISVSGRPMGHQEEEFCSPFFLSQYS